LLAVEPAYQLVLPSCLVDLSDVPARIDLKLRTGTTRLRVEEGKGAFRTETEMITLEPCSEIVAAPGAVPEIGKYCAERPPSVTPSATPGTSSAAPMAPSHTPVTPTSTPLTPAPGPTATEMPSPTPSATPTSTPSSKPTPSGTPTPAAMPLIFVPTDTSTPPSTTEVAATATAAAAPPVVAAPADTGHRPGTVSVYVYHDVNEDGIWNWGDTAPPNMRGDHSWRWDYPSTHPGTAREMGEIGLVGARVALTYRGGERRVEETFHDGAAQFVVPVNTEVVGVDFLGVDGGQLWRVTNVSQKTVNEPAGEQFPLHLPLRGTEPSSLHVLLVGVAEHGGAQAGRYVPAPVAYTIQPGDTLRGIAQAFATTVEALASANGIANPDLIYAGSTITIP
jgi:nucleoid-associated protein YgaU